MRAALALLVTVSCVGMVESVPVRDAAGAAGGGATAGGASTAGGSSAGGTAGGSATAGGAQPPACTHGRSLDASLRVTAIDGMTYGAVHYAPHAIAFASSGAVHIIPLKADDTRAGPDVTVPADGLLGFATHTGEYAVLISRAPDQLVVVRVNTAGAPIRETVLISGGDHAVIGTEWFGDFARTGRLVRTPEGYAAYSALHRRWPDNIGHQGDQLRVVRDDGNVDVFWTWGCSHSGDQRLFSGSAGLAAICQSDCYPQKAIMFMHDRALISNEPAGNCAGGYGGELGGIASADGGFWFTYGSSEGRAYWDVAIVRLDANGSVQQRTWFAADAGDERQPRLASFDTGLVAGWTSQGQTLAQRLDASGTPQGARVALPGIHFDAATDWTATAEGDVVWAFSENGAPKVARLRACAP